ncbi:MAG: chlorite dismutase family protein [Nitrospinae bacterium]|nr:chlorite dismutase family protein [Nitrospinota bacterium]
MRKLHAFILMSVVFLWASGASAQQGQWGGFIYLTPKTGSGIPAGKKDATLQNLEKAAAEFANDFTPEKGKTDTIQYYKQHEYTQDGKPAAGKVPAILVRVESLSRNKVDDYIRTLSGALGDHFDVERRLGVTRELNYTNAETLDRLKAGAPKRGDGKGQPNAVVLPISKTNAWWALTLDKRENYFNQRPEIFGKSHLGHNAVGFMYIDRIFRKLYHSRFIDDRQDFVTYFEFSDSDSETYKKLLDGLRDKAVNPEWEYVQEKPLFWGKRTASLKEIL